MTLSELRAEVRRRADQENSDFISDTELNSYINSSYTELYDILVSRFSDYFVTSEQFTLSGTTSTNPLPATYYKTLGVDLQVGSEWKPLKKWMFAERNRSPKGISYRVLGSNLSFQPEGSAAGTYRHWYIPRATRMTADGDSPAGILDFEEYIIADGAIKCAAKEESDVSVFMAMKQTQMARIIAMASDRDAGEVERVSDVTTNATDGLDDHLPGA